MVRLGISVNDDTSDTSEVAVKQPDSEEAVLKPRQKILVPKRKLQGDQLPLMSFILNQLYYAVINSLGDELSPVT